MTDPTIPQRPHGPHPTPEELYQAHRDPGDAGAIRILRHAAGCARCSQEMARQEAFDQPEPVPAGVLDAAWERFGRGEPMTRPMTRPMTHRPAERRTPFLALAATLTLCLLGLGLWIAERAPRHEEVERGGEPATAGWEPSGSLAAPPAELVFSDAGGEPRRVKVFDAAQSYVWTSPPTPGGRVAFPETERRRLRPGVEYFWTVLDNDGEEGATLSFWIGKLKKQ
jgi:hypothetical protein